MLPQLPLYLNIKNKHTIVLLDIFIFMYKNIAILYQQEEIRGSEVGNSHIKGAAKQRPGLTYMFTEDDVSKNEKRGELNFLDFVEINILK